jgi:YVTN family beta-propeller protein
MILTATLAPLAVLVPLTIGGVGPAAASPSPGYTASLIATGEEGYAVAVDPATNTAYIGDITADELSVVDGSTNTVTGTISLTGQPHGIAVDSATDTVYASVYVPEAGGTTASLAALDVIDGATDTVTDTIALPTGSDPIGVAVDSLTDVVYVAEYFASAVAVIDGSTSTVTATISTGSGTSPREVAVDETSDVVWVADSSGNVFGISGTSNTVTQTVSFSGEIVDGVDVDPDTDTVYAAIESTPAVAVIDGSTGAISTTIGVTDAVYSVAVDPDSGTVFASSSAGSPGPGTTWIIDESSNTIVDTIERGGLQVAANTATGSAYVAAPAALPKAAWVLTPSAANAMSPVIQSTGAIFTVGTDSSIAIQGSALPAATYSETGALPSGVTLSSSGSLSGTPAPGTAGTYPITLTASNGVPPDYSQAFTLSVDDAPAITSGNQTTFYAGDQNFFSVTATGYPAAAFSETGALPPGVTLNREGTLSGTPPAGTTAGSYPIQITASNSTGTATQAFTLTTEPQNATFVALYGVRALDTRNGTGGYDTPVGPGQTLVLQVTGAQGLPTSGLTAVVLNVTATDPTASSYVTVYPDGQARPTASSLNFTAGETTANLVTVPVGADGAVDFYNNSGSVELIADLEGYYTDISPESSFLPAGPSRMLDTRNGTGGYTTPVGPGATISLQVAGVDGVPSTGVVAVVLNVTATDPTASSYVTVYPDGEPLPATSNLNFTPGETVPNLVVAEVGADGKVDFYNHTGSVDLVADLAGYYATTSTSSFVALSPLRVLDTRNGTGGYATPVGPGQMISLQMTGVNGVPPIEETSVDGLPPADVTAVVLNVTATDPTTSSYVTVYPDGETRPTASNLNFTAGETIPNQVVVPVGADGAIDFYNNSGSVDLVADLAGFFTTADVYLDVDAASLAETGPRP